MAVTRVQHVTQAASEGLNAKFGDLCDPHDLSSVRTSKSTISKLTAKSRASNKAIRQLRNKERRVSTASASTNSTNSTNDDAFLMSFIPLKTELSRFRMRHSFSVSKSGSPSSSPDLHLACSSPPKTGHAVTRRLMKLCMGASANKYTPLPVY